ncbi:MAG: anthranilate synthase component I family protein [Candidatus Methylopumilus sp.]
MNNTHLISLPYVSDSSIYFEAIANDPWSCYLDSGIQDDLDENISDKSRYDIIVSHPFIKIIADESTVSIEENNLKKITKENPFNVLEGILANFNIQETSLPFTGGALGYFSYELSQSSIKNNKDHVGMPLMMIGIYDWALIVDHQEKTACIASHLINKDTKDYLTTLTKKLKSVKPNNQLFKINSNIKSLLNFEAYDLMVNKILSFIKEGDVYQINISNKYIVSCEGNSWTGYKKLREINRAPFMAYFHFDDFDILCGSPERFIQSHSKRVETRPIKGTEPRDINPIKDKENAEKLLASEKDRAENLMIVDLLRNDLSKNCIPGSVNVKALCELKSYSNVHHLESIIEGVLKPHSTLTKLLKDCFPGGSITGTPKKRSMEIISDLEPHRRDIYCGSIGYIGFNHNMDTNIAIRTLVRKDNNIHFYSGGGIVAQSNSKNEFDEISFKASNIRKWITFFKAD